MTNNVLRKNIEVWTTSIDHPLVLATPHVLVPVSTDIEEAVIDQRPELDRLALLASLQEMVFSLVQDTRLELIPG